MNRAQGLAARDQAKAKSGRVVREWEYGRVALFGSKMGIDIFPNMGLVTKDWSLTVH